MNQLIQWGGEVARLVFWYCCDFMINLANLTGTSYDETNTWVLLLGIPGVLAGLIGVRVAQGFALRKVRRLARRG